ncbi:hypothetical protein AQ505_16065 [Pedobacter sp. PACM 27299]|uniref:hypothetical protein n=1 Tax=Pedobacter sp. PACM 27299 TaxID=1727164 RepID=UPI000705F8FF|nr:hypothetical protein [Pedobacter sp. PACM 27299]ALL06868.1 hypothetical protein AQ505_16065 [Pedobacter sp. PACM 27299]
MQLRTELAKRFFLRLFIGGLPLAFFAGAMFGDRQSGNSGMSPNMEKFLPVILVVGWIGLLIVEAVYLFVKQRISDGLTSVYVAAVLALLFFLILYLDHL